MLNWIKFLVVFLSSLALTLLAILYYNASKPYKVIEKEAVAFVLNESHLQRTDDVEVYNGNEQYVVVYGVDDKETQRAILLTPEMKFVQSVDLTKGTSKAEAVKKVYDTGEMNKLIHAKLGLENDQLIWEITYKGKDQRLNYVYVQVKDGTWWKRILNV